MSDNFDPYYRWFGIPPKEQPPNHYRLLGIELFESDPQLIDSLALRHTSYLRQITDGPRLPDAQRLLNELAAARRCLLNPSQKAVYDAELRTRLAGDARRPAVEPAGADQATEPAARTAVDGMRHVPSSDDVPVIAIVPRSESRRPAVRTGSERAPAGGAHTPAGGGSRRRPRAVRKPAGSSWAAQVRRIVAAGTDRRARPWLGWLACSLGLLLVAGMGAAVLFRAPTRTPPRHSAAAANVASAAPSAAAAGPVAEQDAATSPLPEPARAEEDVPVVAARDDVGLAPVETAATHVEPGLPAAASQFVADGQPPRLAGLVLWLEASQLTASGGRIPRWNDASDAGYSARPKQKSEQPELLPQALGGKSVVRFRGGQRLEIPRTSQALNLGSEYTFVYVARGVAGTLLAKGSGAKAGQFSLHSDSCLLTNGELNADGGRLAATDDDPTAFRVRSIVADGTALNWFLDGTTAGSYSGGCYAIENSSVVWLGSPWFRAGQEDRGEYFVGDLAELVIYDRALPPEEREGVEAYLREKWLSSDAATLPLDLVPPPRLAAADAIQEPAPDPAEAPEQEEQRQSSQLDGDAPAAGEAMVEAGASAAGERQAAEPARHELFLLYVNLGGGAWQDPGGPAWVPSKKFDSATFGHEAGQAVKSEAVEHPVYSTAVRGLLGFRAIVPNGDYAVELHFHEHWARDAADRAFFAAIEQVPVLRPPMFFQGPGMGQPYVHRIGKVNVKDGRLDVDFAGVQPGSLAILNGIVIRQLR